MIQINEFISSINRNGVVRTNRFDVTFSLPPYLAGRQADYGINEKLITLRCEAVQFPGVSIVDTPIQRLGYGTMEYIPHNVTYEDISLLFLVDAQTRVHKLFYDWVNSIVNFQGSRGQANWSANTLTRRNANYSAYEVGYKKDFTTDIQITMFDPTGEAIARALIYKAFPKLIPTADLAWGSNDELMRMNIPFGFTDFNIEYLRSNKTFPATTPQT